VCDNLNLSITNLADLDDITKVSDSSINLDLILEELLEGGDIEDLVACWLRGVDDELAVMLTNLFAFLIADSDLASTEESGAEGGAVVERSYLMGNLGSLALG